jgi:hypothetical protein
LNLPHLVKDGVSERVIADNGWKPTEIKFNGENEPYVEFSNILNCYTGEIVANIKVDPREVKKQTLELVQELLNDINSKTNSGELFPYPRIDEIDVLPVEGTPNEKELPAG